MALHGPVSAAVSPRSVPMLSAVPPMERTSHSVGHSCLVSVPEHSAFGARPAVARVSPSASMAGQGPVVGRPVPLRLPVTRQCGPLVRSFPPLGSGWARGRALAGPCGFAVRGVRGVQPLQSCGHWLTLCVGAWQAPRPLLSVAVLVLPRPRAGGAPAPVSLGVCRCCSRKRGWGSPPGGAEPSSGGVLGPERSGDVCGATGTLTRGRPGLAASLEVPGLAGPQA